METTIYKGLEKKASRLELFIRIPYAFAVGIVIWIYLLLIALWGILIQILKAFHWIYILLKGERWEFANKHTANFLNFALGRFYFDYLFKKVVPYFILLTDKRPGFTI